MDAGRLARAGFTVHDVRLPGWAATFDPFSTIVLGELWRCHHALVDSPGLGSFVNLALHRGRAVTDEQLAGAMAARATWQAGWPPCCTKRPYSPCRRCPRRRRSATSRAASPITSLTSPFNLAGVPALALPVPGSDADEPATRRRPRREALLCATARVVEEALELGVHEPLGDLLHPGHRDAGALLDSERVVARLKGDGRPFAHRLGVHLGLQAQGARLVERQLSAEPAEVRGFALPGRAWSTARSSARSCAHSATPRRPSRTPAKPRHRPGVDDRDNQAAPDEELLTADDAVLLTEHAVLVGGELVPVRRRRRPVRERQLVVVLPAAPGSRSPAYPPLHTHRATLSNGSSARTGTGLGRRRDRDLHAHARGPLRAPVDLRERQGHRHLLRAQHAVEDDGPGRLAARGHRLRPGPGEGIGLERGLPRHGQLRAAEQRQRQRARPVFSVVTVGTVTWSLTRTEVTVMVNTPCVVLLVVPPSRSTPGSSSLRSDGDLDCSSKRAIARCPAH